MDTLKLQLLRLFSPQHQLFVQLARNIVDRLHPEVDPFRDGPPDLLDQAFHLEVFERRPHDDVRQERGRREGHEECRSDDSES